MKISHKFIDEAEGRIHKLLAKIDRIKELNNKLNETEIQKEKKQGGKRSGAGRPRMEKELRKTYATTITEALAAEILAEYETMGDAVRDLWKAKKALG